MAKSALSRSRKQEEPLSPGMLIFLIVWFGQMISLIGSGMTCFAQSITVYTQMGGSIANIGLLAVLGQVPGILLSPIAGVLADRFDRRIMMIVCDTIAALATLTLRLLIVNGVYQLWHIYLIVIIIATANSFQWPAYFAAISTMVPKNNLGQANGLIAAGRAIGQIAAPFMAGIAVSLFRLEGVILFDLGTYLFSTVILLFVRFPKPEGSIQLETKASRSIFWQETLYGVNYLLSRRGLLGIVLLVAVGNFMLGGVGALIMPMVLSITTVRAYGNMLSISGISLLLGGVVMSLWGGPKRRVWGIVSFMIVQGLAIMIGGLFPNMLFFVLAVSIFNFASSMVNACGQVVWQTKVPPAAQGRVMAVGTMLTAGALEAGILGISYAADMFQGLFVNHPFFANLLPSFFGSGSGRGLAFLIFLLGLLYVVSAVVGYLYPRTRFLESELPDMLFDKKPDAPELAPQPAAVAIYEMDFKK